MSSPFTGPSVDPEHPWLGLHPFDEENQRYFFGRTEEIRDLFLRVRDQPLTILYGQSGLGKTSLLSAGLLPELRAEGYRPVRLLLDFAADSPLFVEQVRRAFAEALADEECDAETLLLHWAPLSSLWEVFAHETFRPTDLDNQPPVLILDQFEEIFTFGIDDTTTAELGIAAPPGANRRDEVTALIYQLADLIEGRAPGALQQVFADAPHRALEYDFSRTPVRVVLTLREDYLAQLEEWKSDLPPSCGIECICGL